MNCLCTPLIWYFCFQKEYKPGLTIYPSWKQKYEKWIIHRKTRVQYGFRTTWTILFLLWPWQTPLDEICFWIFLKMLKVYSRPKFAWDSKSGLRSGRGCSSYNMFLIRTSPQPGPIMAVSGNPAIETVWLRWVPGAWSQKLPLKKPQ